jgi:uncharacterized protein (TIGR02594 family)
MSDYMKLARDLVGTKEIVGPADNPKIMEMYAAVGHDWVEHDETAWCAAFVGYCLEKSGLRSTRALNARSYLNFGVAVELADAKEGDIVVFSRGKEAWQGHVAFFVAATATQIKVLGGNQTNAVTIANYAKTRLLGIRRPILAETSQTPSVKSVQEQLRALGYYEVGVPDGKYGPRTRAAILAFRADNSLPLSPEIDAQLEKALTSAPPRAVAPERATGKPEGSRIIKAANVQLVTGVVGGATAVAANLAPAVENAERANGLVKRTFDLLHLDVLLGPALPWILGGICAVVIVYAIATKMARVEDHQTGRTP